MADEYEAITVNGHQMDEIASMVQKMIRRGEEKQSLKAAIELAHHTPYYCWHRLMVILLEDIGPLNIEIANFIKLCRDEYFRMRSKKEGSECNLALSNAVVALCRSKKSRVATDLMCLCNIEMNEADWEIEIPDEALDGHTKRGRAMGRVGRKGDYHFLKEGGKLVNEHEDGNEYHDPMWTKIFKEKGNWRGQKVPMINVTNVKAQIKEFSNFDF